MIQEPGYGRLRDLDEFAREQTDKCVVLLRGCGSQFLVLRRILEDGEGVLRHSWRKQFDSSSDLVSVYFQVIFFWCGT